MLDFVAFRNRDTKKLFKKLDEAKATGNDRISAAILKRLGDVLAMPFTIICRRLFAQGCWPEMWKLHVIVPIFKKGSAFKAGNYRGVHLTTILSKLAEKVIGTRLVSYLRIKAFGENQWAFSKGLGARDLVTMLMMSWVLAVCSNKKVGAYLSDISGAFDRVFKAYLLSKLHAIGVGAKYLNFLDAYLSPRRGRVVVQGTSSDEFILDDSVFQGTVLGPTLWNIFFADVAMPAKSSGGKEALFADDLNVFQLFARLQDLEECINKLKACRQRVHAWGRANRVSFDPAKEHLIMLHPTEHHGDTFRLLGCMVDPDLRMHTCIDQLLSKIRPKGTAILRTRAYYSVPELIKQYKTHVWGLVEIFSGAYFHAADTMLNKIGQVQTSFLNKLEVSLEQAFLEFNFAPAELRRNIGILGMIHKRVLGQCHPSYQQLLPWYSERFDTPRGFGHSKQLYGHWVEATSHPALFSRSIFSMVDIYNNLPQWVVDAQNVTHFQKMLTAEAREQCRQGNASWVSSFSKRGGSPNLNGPSIDMLSQADDF